MKQYKRAYLEITNVCNLNCSFCPKTTRSPHFLSLEEFRFAAAQIRNFTNFLQFHVMGEPLLHPLLGEFLEECQRLNFKVNLTTNGTLLKGDTARTILSSPAVHKVCISLHSFEANTLPFSMEEYLTQITQFSKAASAQGNLLTQLRLWNLDGETSQGQHQENPWILSFLEQAFSMDAPIRPTGKEQRDIRLAPNTYLHFAHKFEWPDPIQPISEKTVFCQALRDHFAVLCDGTVIPCCLDSEGRIPLGNLFSSPLEEILSGTRAQAIYQGFSDRKPFEELCRRCSYASRFQK
ncbi:MAG: radical SAM/SPASM domain-containing protein [Massiliimalia sp.]